MGESAGFATSDNEGFRPGPEKTTTSALRSLASEAAIEHRSADAVAVAVAAHDAATAPCLASPGG
ncbi:hypothetical protein G9444_3456 [Rhodococcus erythropolis]|uniref:Uncharacterized protein n=1 Tax=Rhodococcus erythropolis TaxID=1833 RepID=A0A6G9CV47_RHOER|nr:hypothetical protein G9444_3456 [Rhodococcus erythropolis]